MPLIELDTKAFRDIRLCYHTVFLLKLMVQMLSQDDVLYTGRTIRAAIDNIVSHGRPACLAVWLTVVTVNCQSVRDYVGKISQLVSQKKSKFWLQLMQKDSVSTLSIR